MLESAKVIKFEIKSVNDFISTIALNQIQNEKNEKFLK